MTLSKLEKILLFLVILLLPTQLGRHFWPPFSFIYSLPIDYLSPTFYFWDILVLALCTVFIAAGKHINWTVLGLFYLFILTQALSLFSNLANLGVGFVRLEQYFIAGLFGVYIASSDFVKIKKIIYWGIGFAILLQTFLAIGQFFKGGTIGLWILGERSFTVSTPAIAKFDFYGNQFLRPYATFPHPNTLGGFLVIAVLIFYNLSIAKISSSAYNLSIAKISSSAYNLSIAKISSSAYNLRYLEKKWFNQAITILSGAVVLLSVSRTAMLAGFTIAFLLLKKSRLVLLTLVLVLLPILYTRFSSVLSFDNLTLIRRGELVEAAFKLWEKSLLFGVGLNNFIPSDQNLLLSGPSRFLQPVHNIFLLTLSETGLVGLLGLLVLLGYPIFRLFKLSPKPYPLNPILFAWGAVVFLGMFDHYLLTLPQGYRTLFLLWGLSFSATSHAKIT